LDLAGSLDRFNRHGDDLMDRWDGSSFRRPIRAAGSTRAVRWRRAGPGDGFLEVQLSQGLPDRDLLDRLESMFVDERAALAELALRDRTIAGLLERHPGVYPVLYLDPLGGLLAMVTAQQVNLGLALSVRRAILLRLGHRIELGEDFVLQPDPERMAAASPETWASLRLTRAKGRCLTALGEAICRGRLQLDQLSQLPDQEVKDRLVELPGLGPWTAGQFLTRVLGRSLVVAEDLGVRKAVQAAYRLAGLPSADLVRELTGHYGRAAFSAQQLLLYQLSHQEQTAGGSPQ